MGSETTGLIRWHWLAEAHGVMLACWRSEPPLGLELELGLGPVRGAGQVGGTPEGMEAGLLGGLAAQALQVLDLV